MKSKLFQTIFLLLLLSALAVPAQAKPLRVVAGTSLIEDIVRDLTAGQAQILTIVQGSACPGHDSSKTGDFVFAASADLVLAHSFQRHMPQLADMLAALAPSAPPLVLLEGKGSWLVPQNQKEAVLAVATALQKAFENQAPAQSPEQVSTHAAALEQRVQRRLKLVDELEAQSLALLAPHKGKRLLAASMQAELAQWAGFTIVRTYGRAEDSSAKDMADILRSLRGSEKSATISGVVDNAQSGPDAGLPLALELGVPHVVLSNFPGSDPGVPDYFSLLRANVAKLAAL